MVICVIVIAKYIGSFILVVGLNVRVFCLKYGRKVVPYLGSLSLSINKHQWS